MKTNSSRLTPVKRLVAAAMLLVWVTAVAACSTECSCADSDSDQMAPASLADSHGHSHDTDRDCDHDDSLCTSLHSLTPVSTVTILARPDFGACPLAVLSPAQLIAVAPAETSISRQPPERDWVFTPEVCLGAAFRSLAPPALF